MKIFVAILLIFVLICALGFLTNGFKDWTFDFDFTKKNDVPTDKKTAIAIDENGNEMYEGEEYDLPSAITFLSESDGSTQTITATVKPDDATIPYLNWFVTWENPTSTWATDKNVSDYMSYSVSSDTKVITLTCLQAFGESIKVRAEWVNDSTRYAECICEYDKRYEDFSLGFTGSLSTTPDIIFSHKSEISRVELLYSKSYIVSVIGISSLTSYAHGADPHAESINVYLTFDKTFYTSAFGQDHVSEDSNFIINLFSSSEYAMGAQENSTNYGVSIIPLSSLSYGDTGFVASNKGNAICTYFYNHSDMPFAMLNVDITHNNKVFKHTIPLYFNRESLAKNVTSVSVDNSVLVF